MSDKLQITHVEIRRVQNGFVIAAINDNMRERYNGVEGPQRCSFVAGDVAQLNTLIESIVAGAELNWLPTVELPILHMHYRDLSKAETSILEMVDTLGAIKKAMGI